MNLHLVDTDTFSTNIHYNAASIQQMSSWQWTGMVADPPGRGRYDDAAVVTGHKPQTELVRDAN